MRGNEVLQPAPGPHAVASATVAGPLRAVTLIVAGPLRAVTLIVAGPSGVRQARQIAPPGSVRYAGSP